jgi:ribosome assembly protein 1
MGANLIEINDAPAGNIVGLGGLDSHIVKLATMTSSPYCPNFIKIKAISMGLIKVAIESESL